MRKQYRVEDIGFLKNKIYIYQDSQLIDKETFWVDEINDVIERLENNGYTQGYTGDQVKAAEFEYKHRLENMI